MKHSEYVKIITDLGKNQMKEALLKGMVKNLPFLASGPWNWLAVKVATWLAEKAIDEAELRIFFSYIDFRTDVQAKDFEAAMIHNHKAQLTGTPEEKALAESNLKIALAKLVSLRA